MHIRTLACTGAAVLLLAAPAAASDWPEFRGPDGQGHSTESGLPAEWSEDRNVEWKTPVPGRGWSTPVVVDGRIWLTTGTADGGGVLRLLAFDADTGAETLNVEVFRIEDENSPNPKNSLASPTPIVDGDRVYVHFGSYGTAAVSTSGEILWTARFPYVTQHGYGGSPILYDDLLVLNGDGYDVAFVLALDTRTGEVRWKADREDPVSQAYSTPLAINVDGRDQIVSVAAFRASAHDPATGAELWRVRYGRGFSNVPRPVYGNGLVFIATGFQTPSMLAVRADGSGDVTDTHVAWTLRRGAPHTPSPLLVGDELYMVSDRGVLTCIDAESGEVHWQHRIGGNYSASPVFADGRIYLQSEEGKTTVIAPGTTYSELAVNQLDGSTLASMAVADGSVFLRTDSHLYRITEGEAQ
ncbi:MAG: PQQ-like beta-propeller repeat protein [Acidobacteria bacterium]|nr:PQQ-like beta-propeller repeat protein [Acidobacteriota bacterium]MYI75821.1 PQQ-like beta-propeller repeat protein [Acidobacteriota bacterium]